MDIVTQRDIHKPLCTAEGDPYEYEFKPINGKMVRAFWQCCTCNCLFEAGTRAQCPSGRALETHRF